MHHKLIIMLCCAVSMIGCSKKEEECPAVISILDTFKKDALQIKMGDMRKKGYVGIMKDSESVKQAAHSALETVRQLNKLQLTDEKLLLFRIEANTHFTQTSKVLKEMALSLKSMADTVKLKNEFKKLLDETKVEIESTCDKKERRRRAQRKKRRECDKVENQLAYLSITELNSEKVKRAVKELEGANISNTRLRSSIDKYMDTLKIT